MKVTGPSPQPPAALRTILKLPGAAGFNRVPQAATGYAYLTET
jgi:hypothetical protein